MTAHGILLTYRLPFPSMRAAFWLIVLALSIAGCGYKGPLYLPKPKPEAQKPAPPPAEQQEGKKPASE